MKMDNPCRRTVVKASRSAHHVSHQSGRGKSPTSSKPSQINPGHVTAIVMYTGYHKVLTKVLCILMPGGGYAEISIGSINRFSDLVPTPLRISARRKLPLTPPFESQVIFPLPHWFQRLQRPGVGWSHALPTSQSKYW